MQHKLHEMHICSCSAVPWPGVDQCFAIFFSGIFVLLFGYWQRAFWNLQAKNAVFMTSCDRDADECRMPR